MTNELLNHALSLSMEFGENWLVDIDLRLKSMYPALSKAELRDYDNLCKEINRAAQNFISKNPKNDTQFIDFSAFEKFIKLKYEWINEENLSKLYSQSCYYALK